MGLGLLELLILACCALALSAAVLVVALVRRTRQLSAHLSKVTEAESEREAALRKELNERADQAQKRQSKEHKRRMADVTRREAEIKKKRADLGERRVRLEERAATLEGRSEEMTALASQLDARRLKVESREQELANIEAKVRAKLEEVASLSTEQARERLLAEVGEEIRGEVARIIQKADRQARGAAEEKARDATLAALAAVKGRVCGEGSITTVTLPSDEMKGRIIGREGRNIRSLEQATGVDLLVDDTPQAILLSSWDPLRRTVAARALRVLVEDGRIHPARIEEVVEKTRMEADEEARERGEAAAFELGITGLHERLILLLGRLSFVTIHGQSLLTRSKEVAQVAGVLADEIMGSGETLRRAGLLHALAWAEKTPLLSHPAVASADLATRFAEAAEVTQAMRALAQPADAPRTPEGVILVTARRLVLSRPGARDGNLQRHMDRLSEVEQLALAREGIDRAVAVRAGRELRVHVKGEDIGDDEALLLARDLALEIEQKIDYPGQVRVLVIRETRAVSFAV